MKTLLIVLLALSITPSSTKETPVVALWPTGLPKDAVVLSPERIAAQKAKETGDYIHYVSEPSVTVYPADPKIANGCCVIVCPGGGYNFLSWPKEGIEVAEWLNSIGVTAAVLKYRVPRRNPERPELEPLQDAQRAIRMFRKDAIRWNVDPDRIGILGFSAGGHLALVAGTHFEEQIYDRVDSMDDFSARPDFLVPIYAAYLGPDYKDNVASLGSLVKITEETPPTFMAVTLDDRHRGVQAALLMAEYKDAGVSAEAHIYASGGHGYGLRPSDDPVSTWNLRLEEWMRASGLLTKRE
jgi:acetyl esterase/lipase